MNRRQLSLALIFAPALFAYACSSSSDDKPPTDPDAGGNAETSSGGDTSTNDDGPSTDGAKKDNFVPPTGNPLEGLMTPAAIAALAGVYCEGPQWFGDSIYFSDTVQNVIKYNPGMPIVATGGQGDNPIVHHIAGAIPLGNTVDDSVKSPTPTLLTLEVTNGAPGFTMVRTPFTGTFPRAGFGVDIAAPDASGGNFDSPNDLVVRKSDGTIYMTDPSYQAGPTVTTNHIWRLKPQAAPSVTYDAFEIQLAGQPNGIALSPDSKTLYVSLTGPAGGPPPPAPRIEKYTVNTDGSLGLAQKFADVPPAAAAGMPTTGSLADGIAVDSAGNVYVAVKNGVDVFKPDGLSKWGKITTTAVINGIAFGGADKKTLFMSSQSGMYTVTVKVAGQVQ